MSNLISKINHQNACQYMTSLENVTGQCVQDSHPDIDMLYAKFLSNKVKYNVFATNITRIIDDETFKKNNKKRNNKKIIP